MSHVIELPDELYRAIARYAEQRGETPESLIIALAREAVEQASAPAGPERQVPEDGINDPARDPWAGFRGVTTLLSPDSLENHDMYLAEEYSNRHESDE